MSERARIACAAFIETKGKGRWFTRKERIFTQTSSVRESAWSPHHTRFNQDAHRSHRHMAFQAQASCLEAFSGVEERKRCMVTQALSNKHCLRKVEKKRPARKRALTPTNFDGAEPLEGWGEALPHKKVHTYRGKTEHQQMHTPTSRGKHTLTHARKKGRKKRRTHLMAPKLWRDVARSFCWHMSGRPLTWSTREGGSS